MADDFYNDGNNESVDDILAEILNSDGSFNRDFNNRFAAYLGEDAAEFSSAVTYDLSDRRGETAAARRVEYESPEYIKPQIKEDEYDLAGRRLDAKLPENVRNAYYSAEGDAMRPEFTAGGSVKYPSMGSGASEQRVVYDADWEEKAKKEAARMQRVREDRMLRGDSAYIRGFVAGGRPYQPAPVSPYVDPLADDDDIYSPEYQRGAVDNPNPFFHSGPTVKRNNGAESGRTESDVQRSRQRMTDERTLDSFASSYERASSAQMSWMEVEDKSRRKKAKKQKRHSKYDEPAAEKQPQDDLPMDDIPPEFPFEKDRRETEERKFSRDSFYLSDAPEMTLTQPRRRKKTESVREPVREAMEQAQTENEELKNTVADIVEKYNRRSEEYEVVRLKAEEEKRIREEQEKADRERIRRGLSDGLVKALDAAEEEDDELTSYDDFSDEPAVISAPPIGSHSYNKKRDEDEYIERLDAEQYSAGIKNGFVIDENFEEAVEETASEKKKKRKKKK